MTPLRQIGSGIARIETHATARQLSVITDNERDKAAALRLRENYGRFRPAKVKIGRA